MKRLPKNYVIVEIIPSHSNSNIGIIVQLQALKISNDKIINRLDLRMNDEFIQNMDLLNMISYDKEMFQYTNDKDFIMKEFIKFIGKYPLLVIDTHYTLDYLHQIANKKESVFKYLDLQYGDDVFENLIRKYQLEPSNHLVDLLYESLIFEKKNI